MNIREKLYNYSDLKPEQVHAIEKVLEHLSFLQIYYEEFIIAVRGRLPERVVAVDIVSYPNIIATEDPELVSLFEEDYAVYPKKKPQSDRSYTPMFFGEGKLTAVVLYREKAGISEPGLERLIEYCKEDLNPGYPLNYLVPDGILVVDAAGRVRFSNFVAMSICRRLGIFSDSFNAIAEALGVKCRVKEFLSSPTFMSTYLQIGYFDVSLIVNPLFAGGEFGGAMVILSDLTLIKQKERELIKKSTVIKEIHHRVKNNLQTITSLLRLQMRRTNSEKIEKTFAESINRILSIALIHEALSQQELEIINIKQTAYKILEMILANMVAPNKNINGEVSGDDVFLMAGQASNLSLCITELIQNAVEHAFASQTEGLIRVSVNSCGDEVQITVQDNGSGISSDRVGNFRNLGMQIVDTITQNSLNGTFTIEGLRTGTVARIRFPKVR